MLIELSDGRQAMDLEVHLSDIVIRCGDDSGIEAIVYIRANSTVNGTLRRLEKILSQHNIAASVHRPEALVTGTHIFRRYIGLKACAYFDLKLEGPLPVGLLQSSNYKALITSDVKY
jgi:hypothetical protein